MGGWVGGWVRVLKFKHTDRHTCIFACIRTYVQVSHHPPVSAFHFANRKGGWQFHSVMQPKSKFLGNSAASIMDGHGVLEVLALGEEYEFTFPSYYVRGLLIGVMRMEISGDVNITCKKTGLSCALTFSNKGFFKGENNSVSGKVVRSSDKTELCKVSGRWDKVCMYVCMDGWVNVWWV